MLRAGEIQRQASHMTYQKGRRLYQEGAVQDNIDIAISDNELSGSILVTGTVRDSGGRFYEPEITVNDEDQITRFSCHCPNSDRYLSMCEHGVALAMKLQERQKVLRQERNLPVPGRYASRTTESFRDMMYRYTVKNRMNRMGGVDGSVRLECSFQTNPGGMGLLMECRIGMKRMYVVKNLVKLVCDVQGMKEVSYGTKGLRFVHDLTAFDAESQQIFRKLEEAVTTLYPDYASGYYQQSGNYRQILLRPYMIDGILDLFRGKTIRLDEQDYPVAEQDPRPLLVMRETLGGAELSMEPLDVYVGQKHSYVKQNRRFWCCSDGFSEAVLPIWKLVSKGVGATRRAPIFLDSQDYGSFCGNVLPVLEPYVDIDSGSLNLKEYEPPEPIFRLYLTMPDSNLVEVSAAVSYGEEMYDLLGDTDIGVTYRNLEREQDIRQVLKRYFKDPGEYQEKEKKASVKRRRMFDEYGLPERDLDEDMNLTENISPLPNSRQVLWAKGEEALFYLLERGFTELKSGAELFVDESIRRLQIKPSPKVNIGIGMNGNLLSLSMNTEQLDAAEIRMILAAYRRRKKYFRMKDGDFLRLDDSGIGVLAGLAEGLQLTDRELEEGHAELPIYRALYLEGSLQHADGVRVRKDEGYRRLMRGIHAYEDEEPEIPEEIHAELRWYQRQGFQWLCSLYENGFGGILADDMGLGKTLQMITFFTEVLRRGETKPILVVAPASLLYNWEKEVYRFAPHLRTCVMAGDAAERKQLLDEMEQSEVQIYITSYDMLKRDLEFYREHTFSVCVLDEAQYIKNAGTMVARAVKELQADHRFAMTGTPVENRLSDLWSIFDFLMPGFLYRYEKFRTEFEEPIVLAKDEAAAEQLKRMVTPFLLRRRKKDVLKDLPDKLEEQVYVSMTKPQADLYRASLESMRLQLAESLKRQPGQKGDRPPVLQLITRLCRLCDSPELVYEDYNGGSGKVSACMELLESAVEEGHRILVFSHYTGMLELLQKEWKKRSGEPFLYLSGKDRAGLRQQMVDRFQAGECPIFFISLNAGGTGLNLTAADTVIHCDPWWNEAKRNQATDRAHRIGQSREVNVIYMVTKDTIEERILELQQMKAELADRMLGGEEIADFRLNTETLAELFSLDREDMDLSDVDWQDE